MHVRLQCSSMERNPLAPALAIGLLPSVAATGTGQALARQAMLFDAGSALALDCVHLHLELDWPLALFLNQVTMHEVSHVLGLSIPGR